MIVGWRVAGHMRTTMVLDAIEMARWSRGNTLPDLRCHSDAGSQFTSIRYGERLAEIGAVPSIGTVVDSFDNALAIPRSRAIWAIGSPVSPDNPHHPLPELPVELPACL